jgi:hypothetical protein
MGSTRTNDERETMSMSEAAETLRIPVSRVRRLCRLYEANPDIGLAFRWSSERTRRDTNGHLLRGHRLPFADAVRELAQARDEAARRRPATMTMGEAAEALGVSVSQVRKLCKLGEQDPSQGLAFAWTEEDMPRPDRNGHTLKGHRLPYVDAVRKLARESSR